ncbi:MAG: S1C family serine protease, partial [Promethearchaeota archaeon]
MNNIGIEREKIQKQSSEKNFKKYYRFLFLFFIILIFLAGLTAGGLMSYRMTSSYIDEMHEKILILEGQNEDVDYQNITYNFDDYSISKLYEEVKDSIIVINGFVSYNSIFGTQSAPDNHVVRDATELTVTFSNGNSYPAMIIGSDGYSDLAVLSAQAPLEEFKPLEIVNSSILKVGDPVIAIGSPFGLGGTMTTGIISQLGRTIESSLAGNFLIANIIQTSVPINPGNSGGPLLDYKGEIVGITTAIIKDSNGLGFAIPSNTILREIESLIKTGSYNQHPWLGISGVDMTYSIAQIMGVDVTYGWLIVQITEDGAADKAGLKDGNNQIKINEDWVIVGGDILIAVDGTRIVNGDTLMSYLQEHTWPNKKIIVTVIRDNQLI